MDASVYLYRHFDVAERLLYVGIANHPKRRLVAHGSANAPWHSSVASSTYERFPNRKAAAQAELMAIRQEGPLWNVSNNPSKLTRALHPVKIPKSRSEPIIILQPSEPCFVRNGVLISFRTGGPADHSEFRLANDGRGDQLDYRAVVTWMEWFGYYIVDGYILSANEFIHMRWIDALKIIHADWKNEYIHRPMIGLEHDSLPYHF